MKKSKKVWARKRAHQRKDQFNWKTFTQFDFFEMSHAPVKHEHCSRRCIEHINSRKLLLGHDETELFWPTKWQKFVDYF